MKRILLSLRLFAGALLMVMAMLVVGPAAHAAPAASENPARSTSVTFYNHTTHRLTLAQADVTSGMWTLKPAPTLGSTGVAYWRSESNVFMTGTSGLVTYAMDNGTFLTLKWSNPYAGSNSYSFTGSALGAGGFHIVRSGGSGNNAQVSLTIEKN